MSQQQQRKRYNLVLASKCAIFYNQTFLEEKEVESVRGFCFKKDFDFVLKGDGKTNSLLQIFKNNCIIFENHIDSDGNYMRKSAVNGEQDFNQIFEIIVNWITTPLYESKKTVKMANIDNITIERIALMHPNLRAQLEADYKGCCLLLPPNKCLRFAQTLRTFKEQSDLYAIGRTVKGRKVTNAKAGKSFHNYGLAFDIVLLIDKNNDGVFEEASYDVDTDWMKVIDFFKTKGWKWGGNFKSFKDYPHLEMSYGFTTTALLAKYNKKQFIEGTNYVEL